MCLQVFNEEKRLVQTKKLKTEARETGLKITSHRQIASPLAFLPKGRQGFTENWTPTGSQFPQHDLWRGTYTYTTAQKRKERPVQLKDYFYRCFSGHPIG